MTTNPQDLDALVFGIDRSRGPDETAMSVGKRHADGSMTILAIIHGEAAEYFAALQTENEQLRRDLLAAGAAATERAAKEACQDDDEPDLPHHTRAWTLWTVARRIRALITPEATSALDAVKRAEYARGLRDAAGKLIELAKDEDALSAKYSSGSNPWLAHQRAAKDNLEKAKAILAMIPEGE